MKVIHQLIDKSRLLNVLYDNLDEDIRSSSLYSDLANFLERYLKFNEISEEDAITIYTDFITTYNKHCKQFIKTGSYPLEIGAVQVSFSREQYDIVLLSSVLFSAHRFRIMELIKQHTGTGKGKALFIGLGPGVEIMLTENKDTEKHAYDLSVNKFLYAEFPDVSLNMELYTGQYRDYFNTIYLIELLEHLNDPLILLKIACSSLDIGGKIIFTTATNIPQFDHIYNFPDDHTEFENKLNKLNLKVLYKEKIPHKYLTLDINSSNHFYITERSK